MSRIWKYPAGWRVLHWLMALMVLTLIPVGLWMASRAEADIWGELTNTLYRWHKAIGFSVLVLMILRIAVKIRYRNPPYPPNAMPRNILLAARTVQSLLYVLLVLTPLFGWSGVTAFPALDTVGGYKLPAMPFVPEDRELAETLFEVHGWLAITLAVLVAAHVSGALRHALRKDGIFRRMV
ncbi:cytochrome b [Chromatocurvus halotolerans]|uniref:Cytochrome b561 n=1 Tax=Chromatocurvus halotolerans TaxID=1132028 RepID=A0A4R2KWG8_9GAMM|nr:cytochrome b/b6 domain-containing protein [Chromatocurvus halotolerans]TCO75586.1 cytochrome b561 [Chromatocurvus halotolerans]